MDATALAGRRVLVTGAGVSGVSAARALVAVGAEVTVADGSERRLAELDLPGVDTLAGAARPPEGTELVVTSPGWRPDSPLLTAAAAEGIEVVGEVELAWWIDQARPAGPATWLAVTGTNGKTTTVGMLEAMLRAAGIDAVACGNVGLPVVDAVLAGHRVLAVELSSFQLHWSPSVRPAAGAVLNIAEDHLDWHGSLAAYMAAKARLLTGDVAIAGVDNELAARMLAESPARRRVAARLGEPAPGEFGVSRGRLVDRAFAASPDATAAEQGPGPDDGEGSGTVVLAEVEDVHPSGPPGVTDALVAAALARAHGLAPAAVRAGLREFQPGAHRSVVVARVAGLTFVDDSKATNPHAAAASLLGHDRVVWLAGGLLKGASVDDLVREARTRLAGVVLFGADRDVFAAALARHAPEVPVRTVLSGDDSAMARVVTVARELAGDEETVVLLAPAAASMDMFTDYRQRGDRFVEAVESLVAGKPAGDPGRPGRAPAAGGGGAGRRGAR
ncbi:UDP-N-acetylmuramoyl-L-alanine--D-glutamate ligase [Actinoalloteichus sp. AHMU CJ021]|uniref:UDP-N-acetylmuramoyl-L-alanine--D-glutamate ligase n=1 Tax=Actinoalloteichus sp. AHMU CJ021 TaxID=2072503 RepID=UPI000CA052EA|nr:UDP-N-acetylmuramoyl-L-alanine--D-glutamate ligase [Actinoalloteichus sp. AHMU CJ021]